jgi:hypothetical protein
MANLKTQNEISKQFLEGSDLQTRENEVLLDACNKLDFNPIRLKQRSSWWGSKEIGAFHYLGTYQGKNSILKIQGIKPTISEIYMINSFQKQNQSKIIRPPRIYASLPWNEDKRYEALILEDTGNQKLVSIPTKEKEIEEFFNIFNEYRNFCLQNPWLAKPATSLWQNVKENFDAWRKAGIKIYPNHPLRDSEDEKLINKAIEILVNNYKNIEPQFMHGHFSARDLYKVENQIVLISNLYWSYRAPFYDAIFGYHWFMFDLAKVENISFAEIEIQRNLWLNKINLLPKNEEEKKLLNLAFLERAAAGLNLDALSIDPNLEISKYLVEKTREEVKRLISIF